MTKKKCILMVRVSTEQQSYDAQMQELHELALKSGYSEENITPVAEKESGIKLSEEERAGLNRMKELIETEQYDCVFAWEISRIARRKKILFSILEYLVDRKIQLVIKEPHIQLLKNDGSIDEGAETIFTLYAQLAETEMRNKMARFKRAKEEGYKKGKFEGGRIPIGYRVNNDGFWEIDPEGAEIVRMIFNMYISGEYSMTELARELLARGYFYNRVSKGKEKVQLSLTSVKCQLSQILKNPKYRGGQTSYMRGENLITNKNNYPQIIDDETWNLTEKRRKENRHIPKAKGQYLLTPLIHCICGASYSVNLHDGTYDCRIKHNAVEKGLKHSPAIHASLIESLAWWVALQQLHTDMATKQNAAIDTYLSDIETLKQKLSQSESVISSMQKRKSHLDEAFYVEGRFTKEKYEELTQKQNDIIKQERNNIIKYQNAIFTLEGQIKNATTFDEMIDSLSSSYETLADGTDFDTMRKIIRRYITNITIKPIEGKRTSYWKKVKFETLFDTMYEQQKTSLMEKGMIPLAVTFSNEFIADVYHHKVYFDESLNYEVPFVFMDRIPRVRKDTRKNRKKKPTIQKQY